MADTAARPGFAQKQHRRPGSRIVPAIPYRLSKSQPSARPITPEGSHKGAAAQPSEPQPEPQAVPEKQAQEHAGPKHAEEAVQTPLTPESGVSGAGKGELPADTSASPSQNGHKAPSDAHGGCPLSAASQVEHALSFEDAGNHVNGNVNGHADEKPPPPTEPTAEPKPAVNGVHRKLTIPSHLPPPFYPSNKTDTPPAEGSDTPSHRHQLSAGALVFRSANESPAPPVTSQEPELHPHEQPELPRPPPGFGPQRFPPFFPAHAQHPSQPGAPWHMPPHTVAPPDPTYANGADLRPSHFPSGPDGYSNPYNGHFSPEQAPFVANGTLTSHSQSPSKAQFGEALPTSEHGEEHRALPYQNGTAPPPAERLEESPFELAAYLSTQFGNPEFADFVLQVRSPESVLVSVPVHGIIVVRSPVIAEAVRRSPAPSHRSRDARRLVDVVALDPFTTGESLEEAVRVLYGAPLLSAQTFLYGLAPYMYENDQATPSNDARRRMQQVLSYIAAARIFQIPSMQARGIEIARMLLRWDTVEQVLQYILQANSGPRSRAEGPDTDDPFISTLLNYALEFVAFSFPIDFKLYTIAPEFPDAPRLPTVVENRQAAHNPRLSKIRFGDAPTEDDHQPSHATVVLSTILLSLPLPLVERLFNHRATANQIGWTGATKILRDVVTERENRRQRASRSQLKPAQDGTIPAGLLSNVYLEERVEQVEPSPLHPSGHRLATKRVTGET